MEQRYWYKAYVVLFSGMPSVIEGSTRGFSPAQAFEEFTKKMETFVVKEIKNVRLYELDNKGELIEPYVWCTDYDINVPIKPQQCYLPAPKSAYVVVKEAEKIDDYKEREEKEKKDVQAFYKDAKWALKSQCAPGVISTVNFKENN